MDSAAVTAELLAGLVSTAGQLYANHQNLKQQRHINDVNWQIAAMNNATQIDMANSAHQREVADLRAAGLNPILSAGGSGASTPSLTSVRGDSAQIQNPVNNIASSARGLARYLSESYNTQLEQAKEDVKATEISNDLARKQLNLADFQVDNDLIEEQLRQHALYDASGMSWHRNEDGSRSVYPTDDEDNSKAFAVIHDMADAFRAKWKDASNLNWRNNLRAIGGAVGDASQIINGASHLMRATNALRGGEQPFHQHTHFHGLK